MPIARCKDLCLDDVDREVVGEFWAAVLGSTLDRRNEATASIRHDGLRTLWINTVPEPKSLKNRVHLDLYAPSWEPLVELGATTLSNQDEFVVLHDPGGNELCVFPGESGDRCHLDVMIDRLADLTAGGAVVLRHPTGDASWTLLADPAGNEFCAFIP